MSQSGRNYTGETASAYHSSTTSFGDESTSYSFPAHSNPNFHLAAEADSSAYFQQQNTIEHVTGHATSLSIVSDITFLHPAHVFIRSRCIEIFVVTAEDMMAMVKGPRPSKIGQVGLRCVHCKYAPREGLVKQAICFPTKRKTIFESVRNFQRHHLEACPYVPGEVKEEYKKLNKNSPLHMPRKYVKAYYAEAATELGLIDTDEGLTFGAPANRTGMPSERLRALIRAVEHPETSASFWEAYTSGNDKAIAMKKFEHMASHSTREVIANAKREQSPFVYPEDFPTISDVDYLLFHQVFPCQPPPSKLEYKGLNDSRSNTLSGLCCKHCAYYYLGDVRHSGAYFPTSLTALQDSSFSKALLAHVMRCPNVPREIKDAFGELKQLAIDHSITTKRGSKKQFLEKVWARMEKYYE
eukprot:CAMPEP_0183716516 /NCGR_PEP_ID=MMETSP0737-20130205/10406_1 /TAXON_ID=385413 /ORGANISM="Thalassiosira miniscula, Strain CCMP1093" /LENGTH=411 /DNA_ID=CAMNT_0025945805 /DNA_START=225 /DNA_END=1460 /DNA_ORIENTATION=-